MQLKIKKMNDSAIIPSRATDGSVGYDLCACTQNDIEINPGETIKIGTGVSIEPSEKNIGGFVFPRSGLATKHGIGLANSVGVIDSDYRGEIIIPLKNSGSLPYKVSNGDRIAQIVFLPTIIFDEIIETHDLSQSDRGESGFGSTGNR